MGNQHKSPCLDLQNGQNNGHYTEYSLYFEILGHYFVRSFGGPGASIFQTVGVYCSLIRTGRATQIDELRCAGHHRARRCRKSAAPGPLWRKCVATEHCMDGRKQQHGAPTSSAVATQARSFVRRYRPESLNMKLGCASLVGPTPSFWGTVTSQLSGFYSHDCPAQSQTQSHAP